MDRHSKELLTQEPQDHADFGQTLPESQLLVADWALSPNSRADPVTHIYTSTDTLRKDDTLSLLF